MNDVCEIGHNEIDDFPLTFQHTFQNDLQNILHELCTHLNKLKRILIGTYLAIFSQNFGFFPTDLFIELKYYFRVVSSEFFYR